MGLLGTKKTEQLNGAPNHQEAVYQGADLPIDWQIRQHHRPDHPWTDFATAWNYYGESVEDGGIHGLGFILRDDLIGVDLDGCQISIPAKSLNGRRGSSTCWTATPRFLPAAPEYGFSAKGSHGQRGVIGAGAILKSTTVTARGT